MTPVSRSRSASPFRAIAAPALLLLAVLAAYFPALRCGFVWNDRDYVTAPALQSWAGLGRIWLQLGATEQYYPVLHGAFWVEHRLWGESALGYHLVNILLHATAAWLFVLVLRRLLALRQPFRSLQRVERVDPNALARPGGRTSALGTTRSTFGDASLLAGLIFALHPVAVESVAWITEQKNTLSTVFYLGAALAYLCWEENRPEEDCGAARPRLYFLALGLFVLALLSKTSTATLPAALLVVLWWRRGGVAWRRDARPLVPWFGLAAAAGLFTSWVERTYVGAQGAPFGLDFGQRCLLAGRAAWFYLGKLLWPVDLIFIYPRWKIDASAAGAYLFPAGVLAFLAIAWACRRRRRGPLAVLLLFLGALFPALGFVNVYGSRFSHVADHWAYLAILPVAAVLAAGWEEGRKRAPLLAWLAAGAALGAGGTLTWRQIAGYRDEATLYRTILARNPDAWLAHNNLGILLAADRRLPEAIVEYGEAIRLDPENAEARNNLGNALLRGGRPGEAAVQFAEAVRLQPGFAEAHNGWGNALERLGQSDAAEVEYGRALRARPAYAEPRVNLGNLLQARGSLDAAIAQYRQALRLAPGSATAHVNLGTALQREGLIAEAVTHYEAALRLDPGLPDAHNDLANALLVSGRAPEAIGQYEAALRLAPDIPEIHYNLGIALARTGRAAEAIGQFEAALRLRPAYVEAARQLAAIRQP